MAAEYRVLGPLEVVGPRGPLKIGSARQRAILTLLVLHAGESVSSARLVEEVWGDDPPPGAHHTLGVHMSGLRRTIGAERIETRPNGYRLRTDGCDTDVQTVEALLESASRASSAGDPRTAADQLAAALALWRGPVLADLEGPTARAEATRLTELRTLTLERWIDADLACGRHTEVIPELRRIVAETPLQEAFSARLMLALYRAGRQAEALDVYLRAREVLDRELGVEPGPELEAMQRAILGHDPALSIGAEAASPGSLETATSSGGGGDGESRPAWPRRSATRRVVTVVAMDARGSTGSGDALDPESGRRPLDICLERMRGILERHGGTIGPVVGDALLAVFGVPLAHEDDALRAIRAAAEMRAAWTALNVRLRRELDACTEIRLGVNTGEVIEDRDDGSSALVRGDAVAAAMRLEQAAAPGEILIGGGTYRLVRWAADAVPAGAIGPSGGTGSIEAFRLLTVVDGTSGHAQRFDSPLVGRERERQLLESALRQATAEDACQLFTLLGPAGVGKSRLVHEFARAVRPDAQVLRGRCPAYGERVALWPVVETIREAARISEDDAGDVVLDRIAGLLGDDPDAMAISQQVAAVVGAADVRSTSDEVSWAIRRTFETIARTRPLVIVFDDLQWAEPSFLDLVESVADTSRGAPILLLCIARPELLELRPDWGGGKLHATSVLLGALSAGEVVELIGNLLGGSGAPDVVERKVVEAADGNPLFVEEFLAMMLEDGSIRRERDQWVATDGVTSMPTPPSIMALLASRLDRVPDDEREVLELASVVGKTFTRQDIEVLVEPDAVAGVARRLGALVRRELIRPDRSSRDRADSYRFKHILIRDATYARLSLRERAGLHERFADLRERMAGDRLVEYEETIGSHLERATHYRRQLSLDDDATKELARRAAQLLGAAGVRAIQRGDAVAANRLLERCQAMWRHSKSGAVTQVSVT